MRRVNVAEFAMLRGAALTRSAKMLVFLICLLFVVVYIFLIKKLDSQDVDYKFIKNFFVKSVGRQLEIKDFIVF